MRKMLKTMVALVLLAALLCPSAMAASYGAKVLTNATTVYNANKQTAGALTQGTSITVKAVSGNWAKISYKGRTGYVSLANIIFNKKVKVVANRDTGIRFVTRASYAQSQYYSATLSAGTTVYVVGKKGDSALISNASGSALGYVKLSALTKA